MGGSRSRMFNNPPSVGASPNRECSIIPEIVGLALSKHHGHPMNFMRAGFPNWAISNRSRPEPAPTVVINPKYVILYMD